LRRLRIYILLVNSALVGLATLLGGGGASWMIDGFCSAILLGVIASFVFEHVLWRSSPPG
jgi:hypothetical protein